jgi:A/G-specific adenine glycosylase
MPDKGVWAGLWTLPLLDGEAQVAAVLGAGLHPRAELQPRMKHVLTHLDWYLHPRRLVLDGAADAEKLQQALSAREASGRWVALADLHNWGLPAPLRRLLLA